MTAGEKIKKRRLALNIKQKDLARLMGVQVPYISMVENNHKGVGDTVLEKFATVLDCNASDLKSDAPKLMVDPSVDRFGAVCNCAVRYCLGRRSYMPSLVCGYLTPLLSELDDNTLACFKRDIDERKNDGFSFGDACDYETWEQFYKAVYKEIERRGSNGL